MTNAKRENKAETKRIMMLAQSIQAILGKRPNSDRYDVCSAADLLKLAELSDTLSALVLHADTEIKVME